MAVRSVTGVQVLAGSYDLSCRLKSFEALAECEPLDTTAVCTSGWRDFIAGRSQWSMTFNGMQDFATDQVDQKIGTLGTFLASSTSPVAVAPTGGAQGSVAFAGAATHLKYTPLSGGVGELAMFDAEFSGSDSPLVRGVVADATTARTATGNGTANQVGAITSAQSVFLGVWVTAVSGTTPSLTVILESDDNSGMTTPTTRITTSAFSAVGSSWQQLAGAVTDSWWRCRWTISGTTPSFTVTTFVGLATYL